MNFRTFAGGVVLIIGNGLDELAKDSWETLRRSKRLKGLFALPEMIREAKKAAHPNLHTVITVVILYKYFERLVTRRSKY